MHTSSPPGPSDILGIYPALAGALAEWGLPPGAAPVTVPAGTPLFQEHEPCKGFPLVLEGEVRVARHSGDGRSMELYRIGPGELCLVSSACLFGSQPLAAHGVAARPTTLLLIDAATFRQWLGEPVFRDFVLGLFAQRMADLTVLIDAVAFHKLDRRLAAALLGQGQELAVTHQARPTGSAPCARSSRGCCAASSAKAGSSWRASASASSTARHCAGRPRVCNPGHRRRPARAVQWTHASPKEHEP